MNEEYGHYDDYDDSDFEDEEMGYDDHDFDGIDEYGGGDYDVTDNTEERENRRQERDNVIHGNFGQDSRAHNRLTSGGIAGGQPEDGSGKKQGKVVPTQSGDKDGKGKANIGGKKTSQFAGIRKKVEEAQTIGDFAPILRDMKKVKGPVAQEINKALKKLDKKLLKVTVKFIGWNVGAVNPNYWTHTTSVIFGIIGVIDFFGLSRLIVGVFKSVLVPALKVIEKQENARTKKPSLPSAKPKVA